MSVSPIEAGVGILLLFVLPGLTLTQAIFPEWRFRGEVAIERAVTTAALALVLSVSLTVVVGFGLLNLPVGFSAAWSNPLLEMVLAVVALAGAIVAWRRGAYRRVPPAAPPIESLAGDDDGWAAIRGLEALAREERRLKHAIRTAPSDGEAARLRSRMDEVQAEMRRLGEERRGQLAQ